MLSGNDPTFTVIRPRDLSVSYNFHDQSTSMLDFLGVFVNDVRHSPKSQKRSHRHRNQRQSGLRSNATHKLSHRLEKRRPSGNRAHIWKEFALTHLFPIRVRKHTQLHGMCTYVSRQYLRS